MIDQKTILKARNANLPEYLMAKGHKLEKEGRQFRVKGASGLVVTDNRWYDHARQQGGNTIDYLVQMEGIKFKDAVAALADYYGDMINCARGPLPGARHGEFHPPPKNADNARALSYLVETRGIRHDVLKPYFDNGRIYEAFGTHNCVFTGVDYDTNEIRYAFQRSTKKSSRIMFESFASDKRYSFSIPGISDTALVFESVIDLFSYLSFAPCEAHCGAFLLSLGGLSSIALDHFIHKWDNIRSIVFCLDGDCAAGEAYVGLGARYDSCGYAISRHTPEYKDWNEQLTRGGRSFPAPPVSWGGMP